MEKKMSNKRILILIIVAIVCIVMRRVVLGIIIIAVLITNLKAKNNKREKSGTVRKNPYNQPSVSAKPMQKKTYSRDFVKSEEQKQKEKWAKRRDKDPWEWDE